MYYFMSCTCSITAILQHIYISLYIMAEKLWFTTSEAKLFIRSHKSIGTVALKISTTFVCTLNSFRYHLNGICCELQSGSDTVQLTFKMVIKLDYNIKRTRTRTILRNSNVFFSFAIIWNPTDCITFSYRNTYPIHPPICVEK